ncbi:hypothetical protein BJX61DRAFT_545729 [Aspergillus egyptiacus]|nr:hypothetical protein BJX61DRAFT_545729 [Aspergillus egyptiacus]
MRHGGQATAIESVELTSITMLKYIYILSILALSAAVTATVESSLLNRLLQLDLGLTVTSILLDSLGEDTAQISALDVVTSYNLTTTVGTSTLWLPLSEPCEESTQYVLCQAYHTFVITSISLYGDLVEDADQFNRDLRNILQVGFTNIWNENLDFVVKVAPAGLPLCLESIQLDDKAHEKAFLKAFNALDPSIVA